MRQLNSRTAGFTDVHLLPVFDLGHRPEARLRDADDRGAPDGETQQPACRQRSDRDCFNWGYDPFHYSAPEGSYASDADDGARRIMRVPAWCRRCIVPACAWAWTWSTTTPPRRARTRLGARSHRARLLPATGRQGGERRPLDLLRQHRHRAPHDGQADDRFGRLWARKYKIDSFRFDLMGHQPRAVMEALQADVDAGAGRAREPDRRGLELRRNRRSARASCRRRSCRSLNGSGIGTFSDRARDAVRGGGPATAARQARARATSTVGHRGYGLTLSAPDDRSAST